MDNLWKKIETNYNNNKSKKTRWDCTIIIPALSSANIFTPEFKEVPAGCIFTLAGNYPEIDLKSDVDIDIYANVSANGDYDIDKPKELVSNALTLKFSASTPWYATYRYTDGDKNYMDTYG